MVYTNLEFSHFIVVSGEGSVIAFARNNSVYKFLKDTDCGWIKLPSTGQWFKLPQSEAVRIRQMAQEAFGRFPVYRVNWTDGSI